MADWRMSALPYPPDCGISASTDIRDFICDSCNTGLGRFKNGQDCLKDALAYIQEREQAPSQ